MSSTQRVINLVVAPVWESKALIAELFSNYYNNSRPDFNDFTETLFIHSLYNFNEARTGNRITEKRSYRPGPHYITVYVWSGSRNEYIKCTRQLVV